MYTSGHAEILAEALRGSQIDPAARRDLLAGLAFPDLPCGSVVVSTDGGVTERGLKTCSLARLLLSLAAGSLGYRASVSYQSHNGVYSLWHAMTADPDKSVANIARNVCEYVLVCCRLALTRRSWFWLGFALHVVMDAYSPAHVLREGQGLPAALARAGVDSTALLSYVRMADAELAPAARAQAEELRGVRQRVVAAMAARAQPAEILRAERAQHRAIAAFVMFEYLERAALPFKVPDAALVRARRGKDSGGRVLNFYFYPQQRGLFHALNDRLAAVRRAGLFEPCVRDARDLLGLFEDALAGRLRERDFLRRVAGLMAARTLAVHPDCARVETGFGAERLLRAPRLWTWRFKRAGPRAYARGAAEVRVVRRRGRLVTELPFTANPLTRPELTRATVRWRARSGGDARSPAEAAWVELTFVDVRGRAWPGYPVELHASDGARWTAPEVL